MQDSTPPRALRGSALAAFAFAAFQLTWLPAPVSRGLDGWSWEWRTIADVAITLAAAVLLWRGNRIAGALVGLYGAWRLGRALVAVVNAFTGTWETFGTPAWVLAQLMVVPFAVFWLRGGIAVLRERLWGPLPAPREVP